MSPRVQTKIVKIGNSRGIRIPQLLLQHLKMTDEVEIEAKAGQLVVRPVTKTTRAGWDEKFREMAARGDDVLLDADNSSATQWDDEQWQW